MFTENSVIEFAPAFLGVDVWLIPRQNAAADPHKVTQWQNLGGTHSLAILRYNIFSHCIHYLGLGSGVQPHKKRRLSDAEHIKSACAA